VRIESVDTDLLRSYTSTAIGQRNHNPWLWEAVRATSAAPAFFEPIQLHNEGATFIDGGVRANNPVEKALLEAKAIWPERDVGLLLSLGAGVAKVDSFNKKKERGDEILQKITNMSMNADRFADSFREAFGAQLHKEGRYFRFSVAQLINDVELGDITSFDKQESAADYYVKTEVDNLTRCVAGLLLPMGPST
jgi:patatin-like phospholipase/acyl hydrolase